MKQQLALGMVAAGLLLTAPAPAPADEGFSIGASAARADVAINEGGLDINGTATGYRVFGTWMFSRNLGVEAGFSTFGKPNDKSIPDGMEVETSSYDVYAVGRYYVSERFSVIGKAGFSAARGETEIGDDDETETHHSSTGPALGIGGQYDITDRFALRSDFDWKDAGKLGSDRMLSLSGVVRF
ncbi:MAG: porin family protein [Woeseiaceae bacterium]|nr:porin family protein [Woeseiaceae bacterium]